MVLRTGPQATFKGQFEIDLKFENDGRMTRWCELPNPVQRRVPAWHMHNFTLYKREEAIIAEMRVKLRSLRLGGLIRVVDKEHPIYPFEAHWTWYIGRRDTWLSENLPLWLHPEYYSRVTSASFYNTSDELLTIVSKFEHLTELRIVDPESLKSEAGKKFRERHPSVRIMDIEGQFISVHDD